MSTTKTWFVTGASKGLGLALVAELLEQGYNVAATSRDADALRDAVGESDRVLPLAMDLSDEESVRNAIAAATTRFGAIDVVVNNAGYGMIGGLEELSDAEARANFEVNVFGSLNVIRAVLPQFRARRSGHIFNVSSIGGFAGNFPGFGIYCATKFAVHGFTESLAVEMKPFGVGATLVMPGYFRTSFLTPGSIATPEHEIADYENVRETQRAHTDSINANQPGDPVKAAQVMIRVSEMADAPLHLFLGADAYAAAAQKMERVEADMNALRALATNTAIEAAAV